MHFCKRPFENIEIDQQFNVYTCCPWYVNYYNIGNITESSLSEIWNSDKVKNYRRKILNNDYSLCNLNKCCDYNYLPDIPEDLINQKYSEEMTECPKNVFLNYDTTCNAKCVICRDSCVDNNNDKTKYLNKIFEEKIAPFLKSTEKVYLSGAGEVFYSHHSQYLVKRISELCPNVRFDIVSNGIACNKKNIINLGLKGKIDKLTVSIHSATKDTYKKIVRAGNFNIILKNLNELKELHDNGDIKLIQLVFIVNSINYKEMPLFASMAKKLNMVAVFCEYVPVSTTKMGQNSQDYLIHLPSHRLHKDFLKVLKSPLLQLSNNCFLNPIINDLRILALSS